ncbi:MAG: biopolymer transporter ExbD [Paracoccaceae bacterium]|jgi:biopolymer transport protein ExbD
MDFPPPAGSRPREGNLLPMINVVFLLLIFFLISARLSPPEPFAVRPPEAEGEDQAAGEVVLYLDAEGRLGWRDLASGAAAGDAALLEALRAERALLCAARDCTAEPVRLFLRADAGAPVPRLAGLLPALAQAGFARVDLVTSPLRAEGAQ